jgi:hypothetical protein
VHASARDGLHTIHVARESSCSNQNPASAMVLGAARMLAEEIRLGCGESFFFFSLFPRKSRLNFQKNYCVLQFVILSILVLLLLITIYLAFEPF